MKLSRRSFIKLIPIAAVAVWSWWFLRPTGKEPATTLQVSGTNLAESQSASTTPLAVQTNSGTLTIQTSESMTIQTTESMTNQTTSTPLSFQFPTTWNGESPPSIDSSSYRLKIDGDVSNSLELQLTDLYAMTSVSKTVTIQCVEGWSSDVPWEGIPLLNLLRQAGSSNTNIAHVVVQDAAGYSTTLSSDEVANLDCMIALKVAGAPLTVDHGYPVRLVAPTRFGEDWVKCVERITVTSS